MKQLKKYCVCLLVLAALTFVTACGRSNNGTGTDNAGTGTTDENVTGTEGVTDENANGDQMNVDDILFDTDGDGVYDHTDVDGDGLLEEIGRDANDVVDDLVNDVTGDGDTLVDGEPDGVPDRENTVENENGVVKEEP